MNPGFIGLGIMDAPMAGHLRAAGHTLFVSTRSKVPAALLDAGAVACASAAEVALQAGITFTMVPDTPDVDKVLFGDNGPAADGRRGTVDAGLCRPGLGPAGPFGAGESAAADGPPRGGRGAPGG